MKQKEGPTTVVNQIVIITGSLVMCIFYFKSSSKMDFFQGDWDEYMGATIFSHFLQFEVLSASYTLGFEFFLEKAAS